MYDKGQGVQKENVYAHMWGNIAASNRNETGVMLRADAAKIITPSQIETAQTLARENVCKRTIKIVERQR